MELINAQRDTLLRPLQIVSGIVERRNTLPILANILIRKQEQTLAFLSTDTEVQITTNATLGIGNSVIATTVAARKLLDILRSFPEESEVAVDLSGKKMTVQCGKSRFNLQTMAAEEFPTMKLPERYDLSFTLSQKTLKYLLSMVYFSMAQQDIRYYLNGLLLVVEDQKIIVVTTDGHRLAYCSSQTEQALTRQEVIIPRKTILELQRLLEESDDLVTVSIAANQIRFSFANIELVSKLVEGKFPEFRRVILAGYSKSFLIGRETLLRCLQRVAILTSDKFKGIRCVISDRSVKISSSNTDQEDAQDEIEIDYQHQPIDVGFNVFYLLDVLNNLKSENIQIFIDDSDSGALITIPDNEYFKYVVMPMRI